MKRLTAVIAALALGTLAVPALAQDKAPEVTTTALKGNIDEFFALGLFELIGYRCCHRSVLKVERCYN